jgi:hypothetical protein
LGSPNGDSAFLISFAHNIGNAAVQYNFALRQSRRFVGGETLLQWRKARQVLNILVRFDFIARREGSHRSGSTL